MNMKTILQLALLAVLFTANPASAKEWDIVKQGAAQEGQQVAMKLPVVDLDRDVVSEAWTRLKEDGRLSSETDDLVITSKNGEVTLSNAAVTPQQRLIIDDDVLQCNGVTSVIDRMDRRLQ